MDKTQKALIVERMEHAFDIMGVDNVALRVRQTQARKVIGRCVYPAGKNWPEQKARVPSNSDGVAKIELWSGSSGLIVPAALVRSSLFAVKGNA
jgi:hypothetical protein